jgi:hypothetical protein
MDIGYGVEVPEILYNLFKQLVQELLDHRLPPPGA